MKVGQRPIPFNINAYSSLQARGAAGAAEGPGAQRQRAEQHPDVVHLGQHHPFSLFFFRRQGE